MKRVLFFVMFFHFCLIFYGQSSPSIDLANKIADKMNDSLTLSQSQRAQVFAVSIQLHNEKTTVRYQFTDRIVVGKELQRIENARDSLFKSILSDQQYILYKQKKRSLVNNN